MYIAGAAAAIGALVVIHLLLKSRPVLHVFPATRFIRAAHAAQKSHSRLRRWLLFLLRGLALASLGLLFARPFLSSGEQVSIGTHAVIVVDTSYSMGLPTDGPAKSRHAGLVRWLREEMVTLDRASFTLITDKGERIGDTGMTEKELRKAIHAARAGFASTRLARGMNLAARIINRTPAGKKILFILSDLAGPALEGWPAACMDADVEVRAPAVTFKRPLYVESIEVIDNPADTAYDIGLRVHVAGEFARDGAPGARIGASGKLLKETLPETATTIELYDSVGETRNSPLPVMAGWDDGELVGRSMYGILAPRPVIDVIWDGSGEDSTRFFAAVRAAADISPLIGMNTGEGREHHIVTGGEALPDASAGSTVLLAGWGPELADLQLDRHLPLDLYRYQEGFFRTGPPLEAEADGRWLLDAHPATRVLSRYKDGTPLLLEWEDGEGRYLLLNFQPQTAGPSGWIHQPNLPIAVKNLLEDGALEETRTKLITRSRPAKGAEFRRIWGASTFPEDGAPGIGKTGEGYIVQNVIREEFAEQDPGKLSLNIEKLKGAETRATESHHERRELWPLLLALLLAFCAMVELVAGDRYGG